MKAFHNDKAVKAKYIARIKAHAKADEIIKGRYWADGKGCAVGCTIHGSNHMAYESELGIPVMLAKLEDLFFENLPNGKAKGWPLRFLSAFTVGVDYANTGWKFLHWLQVENHKRAIKEKMPADVIAAIKQCAENLEPMSKGKRVDKSAAWSAESAARSAARSAASAARSAACAAWSAAWSAARSAESAARSAAWSAARSAARSAESAARSAAYIRMSGKLIALIKAQK